MPVNVSFALTTLQIMDESKTVTRRSGKRQYKPGQRIQAVNKAMGFKKGEHPIKLKLLEVVSSRWEPLNVIDQEECNREGFQHLTPPQFVEMYCKANKVKPDSPVQRIEFKYIKESVMPHQPELEALGQMNANDDTAAPASNGGGTTGGDKYPDAFDIDGFQHAIINMDTDLMMGRTIAEYRVRDAEKAHDEIVADLRNQLAAAKALQSLDGNGGEDWLNIIKKGLDDAMADSWYLHATPSDNPEGREVITKKHS